MIATLTMSPAVDLFVLTDELHTDSKSRCSIDNREPGGGGINVARNLKRLGLEVVAVFPAGGYQGKLLQELLKQRGLPCQPVPIAAETTQNLALSERVSGRQFHLVFPGAELQESEQQACLDDIKALAPQPSYLVISGSLPQGMPIDFFARVTRVASEMNVKVVLDTSGPALKPALEEGVHLVKLNREEFVELGYKGNGDYESRLAMMGEMVDSGYADILIVTVGPDGALLATRDGKRIHVSPPPTPVVSHVGAGDSFVSVMTYQLFHGKPVVDAFRYGVAAAAAAISAPGNQLEGLAKVEEIYSRMA